MRNILIMVVAGILGWSLGHSLYIRYHAMILNYEIEDYLVQYNNHN